MTKSSIPTNIKRKEHKLEQKPEGLSEMVVNMQCKMLVLDKFV